MRNINTALSPGERELFRTDKVQIVRGALGDLIMTTALSPEANVFVGENNETFIQDADVRIICVSGIVIYQEGGDDPVRINHRDVINPVQTLTPIAEVVQRKLTD